VCDKTHTVGNNRYKPNLDTEMGYCNKSWKFETFKTVINVDRDVKTITEVNETMVILKYNRDRSGILRGDIS
jgi:hypothetical protein